MIVVPPEDHEWNGRREDECPEIENESPPGNDQTTQHSTKPKADQKIRQIAPRDIRQGKACLAVIGGDQIDDQFRGTRAKGHQQQADDRLGDFEGDGQFRCAPHEPKWLPRRGGRNRRGATECE